MGGMNDEAAWNLEERFWLEGSSVYEELLHPECVMAFPGVGIMRAGEVLESLEHAPRWTAVNMTDHSTARGDGVLVLAYIAEARRADGSPYRCACTSTYAATGSLWRLIQHQQTLLDQAPAREANEDPTR